MSLFQVCSFVYSFLLAEYRLDQRAAFLAVVTMKAQGAGEEMDVPDMNMAKTDFDAWLMSEPEKMATNWEDDVVYRALFPNRNAGPAVEYDPSGNRIDPYSGALVVVPEATT